MFGVKPRGAPRKSGCRSTHISSYVTRPKENMSDSRPHLQGIWHISGAAYLGGGSWLSWPGPSPPEKAKGQSTSCPHCTPLKEKPRVPKSHLPCGSMKIECGDRPKCAVLASWWRNCTASATSRRPHFISKLESSCRLFSRSWATTPTTGFVAKASVLRSSESASTTLRMCGCRSRCRLDASFFITSSTCSLEFLGYFSTCFFSNRKIVSLSSGLSLKLALWRRHFSSTL
mmetsp:Transcript_2797/g.8417  ORF Transcript_2797/g.8417 Transcript_2797/m.8417 type:complete len:230 (+) Transcript_2797:1244-1933(+)